MTIGVLMVVVRESTWFIRALREEEGSSVLSVVVSGIEWRISNEEMRRV